LRDLGLNVEFGQHGNQNSSVKLQMTAEPPQRRDACSGAARNRPTCGLRCAIFKLCHCFGGRFLATPERLPARDLRPGSLESRGDQVRPVTPRGKLAAFGALALWSERRPIESAESGAPLGVLGPLMRRLMSNRVSVSPGLTIRAARGEFGWAS
jgi:hypothetical protein